jgi:hypothetical protein
MWIQITFIVGTIIVIGLLCIALKKPVREGLVLGALGPYRKSYFNCINEAERADESIRGEHANLSASAYCESVHTDMARRGGPSDVKNGHFPPLQFENRIDYCYRPDVCGEDAVCLARCSCDYQVDRWCRKECAYSKEPTDICMKACTDVYRTNCQNGSWFWI